jgi:hypothetical protein
MYASSLYKRMKKKSSLVGSALSAAGVMEQ